MALRQSDILIHNNPNLAVVDSDFVKGGFRTPVATINDLYALSGKTDLPAAAGQMKAHATIVYVTGDSKYYILKDVTNISNVNGWEVFNGGGGSGGTLNYAANGLHLVNGGTTVILGGSLTGSTVITDGRITKVGIEYGGDYSGSFTNESLITKRYVDTTTLTSSVFNSYTGATAILIGNKLDTSTFNSYTGTTAILIGNKLNTSIFNTFTGTTLPANYYNKSQINSYTASTNSTISNKLNTSIFNTFTGTTLPSNYYNKSQINSYTGATAILIGNKLDTSIFNSYLPVLNYAITAATNGLTCSSRVVCLGGTLTSNITFNGTGSNYHLKYAGDYSSNYTLRSIPDVAYVTGYTKCAINTMNIKQISSTYTTQRCDDLITVSGASCVYLYSNPVWGERLSVVDICGNALAAPIIINGNGKNINNSSCSIINTSYGSTTFVYNGIFWSAIAFIN